jgi:hypothetical protein
MPDGSMQRAGLNQSQIAKDKRYDCLRLNCSRLLHACADFLSSTHFACFVIRCDGLCSIASSQQQIDTDRLRFARREAQTKSRGSGGGGPGEGGGSGYNPTCVFSRLLSFLCVGSKPLGMKPCWCSSSSDCCLRFERVAFPPISYRFYA